MDVFITGMGAVFWIRIEIDKISLRKREKDTSVFFLKGWKHVLMLEGPSWNLKKNKRYRDFSLRILL